ncbi:hypothetical protein AGLY_018154 [Aphis glycines]|uniref:Uncharacterized protein n=1 Tax=Aphis glycines TaxID=307491 RepID=A0A6G0SU09_APHGL|nr:hypothetical protein AGLY_018154 [Aphis glycines]
MNFQQINNSFCSLVSLVRNNAYPTYPEFTTFTSRLKTFNLFPLTSSQDKYSLAESGFIYSGKKDIVESFCCGLILHRWEKEDNPWIEHSRWNSKCVFVLLSKGNQFVENIVKKYGSIELVSKKSVTVGLLVNKQISIIILLECKLTKKLVTLDLDQWCKLMCENNFNTIIENLHTRCKRVKIADNFFYSVNVNQSTIVLYSNDNYITLSHIDLHRLKQLQHCIDLYIVEKQKKLESYQKTFDTAYALIKSDVNGLPSSCQRNEFTNQYIQNYDFSYSNIQSEDCSFMYELLQFHFNSLSNMILQDLVIATLAILAHL